MKRLMLCVSLVILVRVATPLFGAQQPPIEVPGEPSTQAVNIPVVGLKPDGSRCKDLSESELHIKVTTDDGQVLQDETQTDPKRGVWSAAVLRPENPDTKINIVFSILRTDAFLFDGSFTLQGIVCKDLQNRKAPVEIPLKAVARKNFTITVVDKASGKAVAGLPIIVSRNLGSTGFGVFEGKTNDQGKVQMLLWPDYDYIVGASAGGPIPHRFLPPPEGIKVNGDGLVWKVVLPSIQIQGIVVGENGEELTSFLGDLILKNKKNQSLQNVSIEYGRWAICECPPGVYEVSLPVDIRYPSTQNYRLATPIEVTVPPPSKNAPPIKLMVEKRPECDVKFIVQDGATKEPLAGVALTLFRGHENMKLESDQKGIVETKAPPGTYRIVTSKDGYECIETPLDIHGVIEQTLIVMPVHSIVVKIQQHGGQLSDHSRLSLVRRTKQIFKDYAITEGSVQCPEVPEGEYILEVTAGDGSKCVEPIHVNKAKTNFTLPIATSCKVVGAASGDNLNDHKSNFVTIADARADWWGLALVTVDPDTHQFSVRLQPGKYKMKLMVDGVPGPEQVYEVLPNGPVAPLVLKAP